MSRIVVQPAARSDNSTAIPPLSWSHFVSRTGPEGKSWLESYTRFREVDDACWQALIALRKRDLAVGRQLLDQAHAASHGATESIRRVLERWLFGAEAYYSYCVDDFNRAEFYLDRARRAVISAVGELAFLLPLANHCVDFEVQKARCARQRREWELMARHIIAGRDMVTNHRPLCVLDDGRSIFASAIQQFYISFAHLSPEDIRAIQPVIDDKKRLRNFKRTERAIYILPGFVIDYK